MSTQESFHISRTFKAPRDLVWECWTQPNRIAAWLGPKGGRATMLAHDLTVGGGAHFSMEVDGMPKHWGKFVYRQIAEDRLVWEHSFADKNGQVARNPWNGDWPLKLQTTVTFKPVREGTFVSLEWTPINASQAESAAFAAAMDSMSMGWGGSFDQLEDYLSTFDDDEA